MRAIRVSECGGPENLKLQDVPDPKPDSGQVLVRVKAAGVNPVDTYIRSGAMRGSRICRIRRAPTPEALSKPLGRT